MSFKNLKLGVYGGLAGGLAFGVLMGMMGVLPMIGKMFGFPSAAGGFVVHLLISAVIGAGFAAVLGRTARGLKGALGAGLGYGLAWWLLGPLTLMPLFLGMGFGVNWNAQAAGQAMPSLMGHLIFGGILGLTYNRLVGREVPDLATRPAEAR